MEPELKPEHQHELRKFLHFFELKREESAKELETAMSETARTHTNGVLMFSFDDVQALLVSLKAEAKAVLAKELHNITRMSAIYAKTLMQQLDNAGLAFSVDTSYLENQRLIEEMARLEKMQRASELPKNSSSARLPTLTANYVNDPAVVSQLNYANEELASLRSRNKALQEQIASILQDKQSLSSQYQSQESASKGLSQELNQDRLRLQETERLVAELKAEQEGRLRDSKQVKQLKEFLDQKNALIKQLREELDKLTHR